MMCPKARLLRSFAFLLALLLAGAPAWAVVVPDPAAGDIGAADIGAANIGSDVDVDLPASTAPAAAWEAALLRQLEEADARTDGELGVSVLDLASGRTLSYRGEERWYLASGIKVPVAIAVLRAVEAGELSLATTLRLQADDYVDGAGPTKRQPPGAALRVDWLLEQMLVHSDNTASDVLIRQVGIDRVNAVADELMSGRCGPITSLADVRRHAYSALHAGAFALTAADLLALKQAPFGRARYEALARILGVAPADLLLGDIGSAFDRYYASSLNAAPLDEYARLLAAIAEGRALGPGMTGYLLEVLGRVETGRKRIRAGLPAGVHFAHKTGTQLRRQCDFGIVSAGEGAARRQLAVAACTRGARSMARGEAALRAVGAALATSGALAPLPPPQVHASAAARAGAAGATAPR